MLIFILKLDEPFRNEEIFIISPFSIVQIRVLGVKKFFLEFLIDILYLGSGYFCRSGSGTGNQNLADSTDPNVEHCKLFYRYTSLLCKIMSQFKSYSMVMTKCLIETNQYYLNIFICIELNNQTDWTEKSAKMQLFIFNCVQMEYAAFKGVFNHLLFNFFNSSLPYL